MNNKSRFLDGQRIEPPAIDANISLVDLIDKTFNAYNAARFREVGWQIRKQPVEAEPTNKIQRSSR